LAYPISLELRVGIDVGSRCHSVAIGLSDGRLLEEFEITHTAAGFRDFFKRVEASGRRYQAPIAVAMEGYNGHVRPLDSLVMAKGWPLYNVNNLKLARFKEIFPAAAKNDRIDTKKTLELFQLRDHLPMAGDVLQETAPIPEENNVLKRLSRRQRHLVDERIRLGNAMGADLQAVCPGLLEITREVNNYWFLNFLTSRKGLPMLARLRRASLLKIPGVGQKYADLIQAWQKKAFFSHDVDLVGDMIQQDAKRLLELREQIKAIKEQMARVANDSAIARQLDTIPGFGLICTAELAGEIGTIERFRKESSLAVYLGMANLDHSSGKSRRSKRPKHVNVRAKAAMRIAVDKHRKLCPQSKRYYEKRRAEGKTHHQAIRALGRHLCPVIFKMLKEDRPYQIEL